MSSSKQWQTEPETSGETSEAQATFAEYFEANLNRELLIATLDDDLQAPIDTGLEDVPYSTTSSSTVARGLQVPSRAKSPASGFQYPPILEKMGVSQIEWEKFSDEIRSHARMNKTQWAQTIGGATGTIFTGSLMLGLFSVIPGIVIGKKMRDKHEKRNFQAASQSGALLESITRWNRDYFFLRGLAIRVDVPSSRKDIANLEYNMDLSTSEAIQQRSDAGSSSTSSSRLRSRFSDSTEREEKFRAKAARRGRIVLMPLGDSDSNAGDFEQVVMVPSESEGAASTEEALSDPDR